MRGKHSLAGCDTVHLQVFWLFQHKHRTSVDLPQSGGPQTSIRGPRLFAAFALVYCETN